MCPSFLPMSHVIYNTALPCLWIFDHGHQNISACLHYTACTSRLYICDVFLHRLYIFHRNLSQTINLFLTARALCLCRHLADLHSSLQLGHLICPQVNCTVMRQGEPAIIFTAVAMVIQCMTKFTKVFTPNTFLTSLTP